MAFLQPHKGEPVHQIAQQEYDKCAFENFPDNFPFGHGGPSLHYKTDGVAHREQERRKYKVRWGKPVPGRVIQRRKTGGTIAGRVYDNHKANRHSTENVQGGEPLL